MLLEDAEMLQDIRDFDEMKRAIEAGEEEVIPSEVVYVLLDDENPIRVWREFREMTRQTLAKNAGISQAYLSQLETGKRTGSTDVLTRIAQALNLTLDDIV